MVKEHKMEERFYEGHKCSLCYDTDYSWTLEEIMESDIEGSEYWKRIGWFEEMEFEDGSLIAFGNYYGSEGGYIYDGDLYTKYEIDDMEDRELAETIEEEGEFVEEPLIKFYEYEDAIYTDHRNVPHLRGGVNWYYYKDGKFYTVELDDRWCY